MHELAVTESLLELAIKHANKANAKKVTDLYITVGSLNSIVDDSVQFYWDMVSQKTICENAQLHFDRKAAIFRCEQCATEFEIDNDLQPCPNCKSVQIKIISGEEFFLSSITCERDTDDTTA